MIRLNQTATQLLSLITAQNGANVVVSYSDKTTTAYSGNTQVTNIITATTTTICDTPAASTIRDIDHISIKNTFAGSHTITVQLSSGGTLYPMFKTALLTDEVAEYTHGSGWKCFDANGNIKTTPLTAMTSAQLAAILSDETGTGSAVFATNPTLSLPNANNFRNGLTSTATAAGTTTLTSSSNYQQMFTGTTTQTVVMPDATTLVVGHAYYIHNESTGTVTVNANGGGLIIVMAAGTGAIFVCTSIATAAGAWDFEYFSVISASGKKLTNNATLTLAGTDETIMTFPSTSATIARTDAANTFVGQQVTTTTSNNGSTIGFQGTTAGTASVNGSYNSQAIIGSTSSSIILTGITNSGYFIGGDFRGVSNSTSWQGTLSLMYGVSAVAGHVSCGAGATIGSCYAGYFSIQNSDADGTINNAYGLYVTASGTSGTITNKWGVYQALASYNNAFAGNSRFGGVTTPVATVDITGSLAATTTILSSGATSGIGYTTGAGGTVTQATSRTTGVTINKVTGAITLVSAAGSATPATFTVTNSAVAATDNIIVQQKSGTDLYNIHITAIAAGSFNITSWTTGGTTTEQPVFNFSVIKGVSA